MKLVIIKKLDLINFRNYERDHIEFDEKINIIHGKNAQGKTNILEGIYYCARGMSFKNTSESDIIKFGENQGGLRALIGLGNLQKEVSIQIYEEAKKKIQVNGVEIDKLKELKTLFDVVIFSPEDLKVIKEGPFFRRKFLDEIIYSMVPQYRMERKNYDGLLRERNSLLKSGDQKYFNESISVLNKQLAKSCAYISYIRNNFLRILNIYANINHGNLSRKREELKISFQTNVYKENVEKKLSSLKDENIKDKRYEIIERIERDYLDLLENSIERDKEYKNTYYGIHKDDFDILINGISSRKYGSQGQQRTAILSLILAEIDVFYVVKGSIPILLLDDVFSELDENRQNYLLKSIKRCQTIMTTNSLEALENKNIRGKTFEVFKGKIINTNVYKS